MTLGMRRLLLALALFGLTACASATTTIPAPVQDPQAATDNPCVVNGQTYCAVNPDVTPATIQQTICVQGWTKTIRPDVAYTSGLKRQQLAALAGQHQGDPQWNTRGTEEDHRLPLELGGAPRDENNLTPEVHRQSVIKDGDENAFRQRACGGEPLRKLQAEFIAKWLGVYPAYAGTGA